MVAQVDQAIVQEVAHRADHQVVQALQALQVVEVLQEEEDKLNKL